MQLPLPLLTRRPAAPPVVVIGRDTYRVVIARHRRARRYVLRLSDDTTVRLTVPRGASIAGGLRFAERQGPWIDRERRRRRDRAEPWRDGTRLWFRGDSVALAVSADLVTWATERLTLEGGAPALRPIVEDHLLDIARRELPDRCRTLAATHGLTVASVSVRNQRSRWGACSPRRVITLNWRLIQMPASVSDYVILHELMHLRQANHSRRFWREVDGVCAWWRDAERWLRKHGREIL